ncbi:serine hydrolase [Mesorhizobium sp. DCY119]|uniref:serine hydrolase domain-containing protein n=1 Tax=Mesorhizobium sp. DCY119 TaxID=2108445 RepID=UPI000E70E975|nr:serine hydrolase [Mesorhizobium sp. DCY119]RJG41275.1 class C beta-lactamase-related serine hydrolase [Mesorhizobium sp. DCY119]
MPDQPLNPRDPLNPGAPIIPRDTWDCPPHNRWTFQHIREMTATAQIWRGTDPARALPSATQDLGAITFDVGGEKRSVAQFLDGSFTDGFLVLHKGKIVAEEYRNGMKPHGQHLAMSVTKSITGIVTGILAGRGVIDVDAPITDYLPELAVTGYKGATVQHILDMTSGVVFDESYTTPGSHMQKIGQACGWSVYERTDWPRTMWHLILSLDEREREHGALFKYRSIETDVLGFVLERVTATSLADLISRELWSPMGAAEDAYITVDDGGAALADGGLCATLLDYGRFAQLLLDGGARDGRQIVPAAWIEATRNGNGDLYQGIYRTVLPDGAYSNKFWIEDTSRRAMWARGVFGQSIYIDPDSDFAVVKLSTWPEHSSPDRSLELLAAMRAIRSALGAD